MVADIDCSSPLFKISGSNPAIIGTHQKAISAIVKILAIFQQGKHWSASRFMKGIFHLRPPQPIYTKTWNVSKVLSYLKSFGPNDSLSLKQLTLKTEPC